MLTCSFENICQCHEPGGPALSSFSIGILGNNDDDDVDDDDDVRPAHAKR